MSWVQRQMQEGADPRAILSQLIPNGADIPEGLHDVMLWKIIVSILSEPPKRKKLPNFNSMNDFLDLISKCNRIIVLTGAGVRPHLEAYHTLIRLLIFSSFSTNL